MKLGRIQRDFGIASNIVALVFGDHPERVDMFQQVARAKRGPDVMWRIESLLDRSYIFNLMPLSGAAAVEGYLVRIESMLREGFGDDLVALKVAAHTIPLSDRDPLAVAKRLMQRRGAAMLNPTLNVALALVAVILEAASSWFLFDFTQSTTHVALFLMVHAVASAALSWMLLPLLPAKYRHPVPMVLALLFSFAFFVPFLGVFGLLLAVLVNVCCRARCCGGRSATWCPRNTCSRSGNPRRSFACPASNRYCSTRHCRRSCA